MKARTLGMIALGWLAPGGAYLAMRQYGRFAFTLVLVGAAFIAGIALHGGIAWPRAEELQGMDGLSTLLAHGAGLVKAAAGGPYLLARLFDYSQTYVGSYLHEYGTTLLVMAGLINLLALADALELQKAEAR